MNLGLALFGALVLLVIASRNWRLSVKAALALVVVEGAIRKWVLPQASDLIYFLKDIVLLGAYARYFIFEHRSKRSICPPEMKIMLWIAMIIIGLQVFNIRLASAAVGMFGFKAYLLYVPLCFMLRDVFRSTEELQSFLKWYLLLVLPVGALGALQFFSPPDSPINTYVAGEEADIATFGGPDDIVRARITGTFSYISGYTAYLTVCQALLFSMLSVKLNKVWMATLMGAAALLMGNLFMTGSRGPVFSGVIVFAGFLIFNQLTRSREVRKAITMLLLTGAFCGVASVYWFNDALDAFWQRVITSDSASERASSSFVEPLLFLSDPEVLGYGAGATHPGAAGLRARFGLPEPSVPPPDAENETVRVMLELGVFGFLVWYGLKLYLILELWRTRIHTQNPFLKNLALAAFLTHAILFTGTTVLNHTAHVYFWFMAGFIFLLPHLDSVVAQGPMENNRYSDGSGGDRLHKPPVAAAPGIIKSVRGQKHSHY